MRAIQSTWQPDFVPSPDIRRLLDWKGQVERATQESDAGNLTGRVHAAEAAIFRRWQEMEGSPSNGYAEEREAIRAATEELLSIKIQKLQWPDFRSSF
jgi:hypothetical protein